MNAHNVALGAALTPRHIGTLERAVRRYQSLGLESSLGVDDGMARASIWHVDPNRANPDTYQLDVEQRWGKFDRVVWIVKVSRSTGMKMTMADLGQTSSHVLLFALMKAETLVDEDKKNPRQFVRPAPERPVASRKVDMAPLNKLAATIGVRSRHTQTQPRPVDEPLQQDKGRDVASERESLDKLAAAIAADTAQRSAERPTEKPDAAMKVSLSELESLSKLVSAVSVPRRPVPSSIRTQSPRPRLPAPSYHPAEWRRSHS